MEKNNKMNASIKYWILSYLAIPSFILLHSGCDNNATNPIESQTSELQISDVKNIVWTLAAFEKAGQDADISAFPPFHLIFDETQFFGDDGCNHFRAMYEARTDSVFPGDISQTLRLCIRATFPLQHLTEPYRIHITKSELRIFVDDAVYTYKSDVTDSIKNSPLIGNWQLSSSTDPEFAEIQTEQLIPKLSFDENREFKIIWSCASDNPFGCDEISGIFGIGAHGKILFYPIGWQHHQPGIDFMLRILNSSFYWFEPDPRKGGTLTFFNESDGVNFEFRSISRSGST